MYQAVDKTVFEKHPHIQDWLERCKNEITDYQETNGKGAEAFGQWAQSALSKLESS